MEITQATLKYAFLLPLLCLLFSPLPCFGLSSQELLQVGTGAFHEGFYQVAEAKFREFLRTYPQHARSPEVMYLLGKAYYEQNKLDETKKIFIELLSSKKTFPADDAVYFWLGRTCEKSGDISDAQSNLLTVAIKYPQSIWYHPSLVFLGKIFFQEGQFKRSEMYLRKSLKDRKITPSLSCDAKFWLALTLYEQGKYDEVEYLLQEVVDSKFKKDLLEEALYWLGETCIKLKKYRRGALMFQSLLKHFPQSSLLPNALYGESLCLYMFEKKEEALKNLLSLKNNFPHTPLLPQALFFIGGIYIDLGRYQEAIDILKEFRGRFLKNQMQVQALLNLGWSHLNRGDLTRVIEIFYEILKLPVTDVEKTLSQYILAELNTFEGNCQESMPYWFNLLNTGSYRHEALFKIALCSFHEGRHKESLVNIDLLQLEYPNFYKMGEALWIQGESYRELGNKSEGSRAYLRIVDEYKKSSWYPWCLYRLISIFLDEEGMQKSGKYFDILQKRHASHELFYEAALKLGVRKVEKDEYEAALNYLALAEQSPNKFVVKSALCWQGEIYFNLNEYQKALDSFQRIVFDNPSSRDEITAIVYLEMGNINYLLDDQEKAREAYKKAMEISRDEKFKEAAKSLLKELKESDRGGI